VLRSARMISLVSSSEAATFLPALEAPPYPEYIAAVVEGGVNIVETAGRSPGEVHAEPGGNRAPRRRFAGQDTPAL